MGELVGIAAVGAWMAREYPYKPIALIQAWWYTITRVICCSEGGRGRVRVAVAVLLSPCCCCCCARLPSHSHLYCNRVLTRAISTAANRPRP